MTHLVTQACNSRYLVVVGVEGQPEDQKFKAYLDYRMSSRLRKDLEQNSEIKQQAHDLGYKPQYCKRGGWGRTVSSNY